MIEVNRTTLLIMKKAMTKLIRGGIPKSDKANESDKAETSNFLTKPASMKFDGVRSTREHILKMVDIAQKLNDLEVPMTN